MGTSTSSKGPGSLSPLVPPWADVDGLGPGPDPQPNRFQAFRTRLGKFVSGGDERHLRSAIGHYARSATGGAAAGPRRYGAMARAGGALFDTLSSLRSGGPTQDTLGVDLSSLSGRPTDYVVEAIANALTPADGDADRVRIAITEALSECLEGVDEFDFNSIDDEMLVRMILAYTRNCIFEQIILDSRDAFAKAADIGRIEQAEEALRELVTAATDTFMRPLLHGNVGSLTGAFVQAASLGAISEIWAVWEGYEP